MTREATALLVQEANIDWPTPNNGDRVTAYWMHLVECKAMLCILTDEQPQVVAAGAVQPGSIGYINALAVQPTKRGEGYGARILHNVAQAAKLAGSTTLELCVGNAEVIPFFERYGFDGSLFMRARTDNVIAMSSVAADEHS